MKKPKIEITNRLNYVPKDEFYTHPVGESKTVIGEAYTIQELYERASGGLIDSVYRNAEYDEDPEHDDIDLMKISDMDLTEIAEAKELLLKREVELSLDKKRQDKKGQEEPEPERKEEPEPDDEK